MRYIKKFFSGSQTLFGHSKTLCVSRCGAKHKAFPNGIWEREMEFGNEKNPFLYTILVVIVWAHEKT